MQNAIAPTTYDEIAHNALMAAQNGLRTFADVARWDVDAQLEIEKLERAITAVGAAIAQAQSQREEAQLAYASRSLVGRLFGGKRDINKAESAIKALMAQKAKYEEMAEKLGGQVDFTPNNTDEQRDLLKQLKQYKKELQAEKKEVAANMAAVRVAARQASANIGPNYGIKFVGTMNAAERRSIRLNKETALRPNENKKAAIERQIIALDRRILWAERFKD